MKRTPLRRSGPPAAKKRIKAAYRASAAGQAALSHMKRVKALPCAVCGASPPSDAHHVIHERYGSRKASDLQVIPLCKAHHQEGPLAIHNGKERWRAEYGADWSYLPWVEKMLSCASPADGGM